MQYKMSSNEDFSIITKTGGKITVPDVTSGVSAVFATQKYVEDLVNYQPIKISSFAVSSVTFTDASDGNQGTSTTMVPRGNVKLPSVTFNFTISKAAKTVVLKQSSSGTTIKSWTNIAAGTQTYTDTTSNLSLTGTSTTNWFLSATEIDDGVPSGQSAVTVTSTAASVSRQNYTYYGTAAIPSEMDSAFVVGLATGTLGSGVVADAIWSAAPGSYFWYAIPARYVTSKSISFRVGSKDTLPGGVSLIATIQVTSRYGYEESYNVYRSDQQGGTEALHVYVTVA